jgi:hypothetical protein
MKFEEVLPALRAGHKIRRAVWGITCDPIDPESNVTRHLNLASLLADDWSIAREYEEITTWRWVIADMDSAAMEFITDPSTEEEIRKVYMQGDQYKLIGRIEETRKTEQREKGTPWEGE